MHLFGVEGINAMVLRKRRAHEQGEGVPYEINMQEHRPSIRTQLVEGRMIPNGDQPTRADLFTILNHLSAMDAANRSQQDPKLKRHVEITLYQYINGRWRNVKRWRTEYWPGK